MKRLLVIAGSDSSGGAGVQADLKTAQSFGVYAQTAITAVTVQNTLGVTGVHGVPPEIVRGQIVACLSDIGADAIKTGMLGSAAMVETVAATLEEHAPGIPLVVDPNLPDAEVLTGILPANPHRLRNAAMVFQMLRGNNVLFKGGHDAGDIVRDTLWHDGEFTVFEAPRQHTIHTHGTGCTMATAIACGLAQGRDLVEVVARAHSYVQAAIRTAPGLGRGHGPLNHS